MKIQNRFIIKDREQSSVAEAFRVLCSCLQEANTNGRVLQTVLFASASLSEGNAMSAVNTAAMLAYTGKRVVLVDCDLRNPVLQEIFNLPNKGVSNIILEEKPLEQMLQNSGIDKLKVLTSGTELKRPVELLSNARMRGIIEKLKTIADYIIINSSPLVIKSDSIVSDTCILAAKVDGVVLVIDSRTVRIQTAKKVMELLNGARGRMIGVVLNDVQSDKDLIYYACSS